MGIATTPVLLPLLALNKLVVSAASSGPGEYVGCMPVAQSIGCLSLCSAIASETVHGSSIVPGRLGQFVHGLWHWLAAGILA